MSVIEQGKHRTEICSGVITIGEHYIRCSVLDDGTRVIAQQSFMGAIGRSEKVKKSAKSGDDGLPPFLSSTRLKPFVDKDLLETTVPVLFLTKSKTMAYGYSASLLPAVCSVYVKARNAGLLTKQQMHIATACEIMLMALADVGIIGLVDEATGYQADRSADALQKILSQFISKALCKWVLTFDAEFYRQLFRLRRIDPCEFSSSRPQWVGHITNDIVYRRLAPSVLSELQKRNPRTDSGWRKHQHHRLLTRDNGYIALKEHISIVTTLMTVADTWDEFYMNLNIVRPLWTNQRRFSW